jgi:hypothetical protein
MALKLLNFCFAIINDKQFCNTAKGHFTLGIYNIESEDYNTIAACIHKSLEEIENIKSITIKGVKFNICYTWCSDMKFLLSIYGINAPSSNHPCLWCIALSSDFENFNKQSPARTLIEAALLYESKSKGYIHKPLTSISFANCLLDILHMMLRITDKLFTLLFDKIQILDGAKDYSDFSKQPNLYTYLHWLEFTCNIKKPFYIKNRIITLRSLNGLERLKILEQINLVELLPELDDVVSVQNLWKDFFYIYVSLKNQNGYPNEKMARIIQEQTLDWIQLFKETYRPEHITPYMHDFVKHLHQMISIHGDISLWSMQGLEKLNDMTTRHYFCSTNRSEYFLNQLINKRNRLESAFLHLQNKLIN